MKDSWKNIINDFKYDKSNNINTILDIINKKREDLKNNLEIYPDNNNIFKCFNFCEIHEIKVVIIGQDPYHGPGQATGLCFAINENITIPPSLRNIKNELFDDLQIDLNDLSLESWAKQGILLMNASFTVIQGQPSSQMSIWKKFTDYIIYELNKKNGIIFVAWGAFAYNKFKLIDTSKHTLIVSSHPSPLSYFKPFKQFPMFKGSKPFSKINNILAENNQSIINW